tara:strand:+ start:487 stop:816 length:330 start_codon:yes stop_codon:yes gene_type:complete
MARPHKAEAETLKRREVRVDDATWEAWKKTAAAGNISASEYVRRCCSQYAKSPSKSARTLQAIQAVEIALGEVAAALRNHEHAAIPELLLELVAIERRCADLHRQGGKK